jgi:hypothetical protein
MRNPPFPFRGDTVGYVFGRISAVITRESG